MKGVGTTKMVDAINNHLERLSSVHKEASASYMINDTDIVFAMNYRELKDFLKAIDNSDPEEANDIVGSESNEIVYSKKQYKRLREMFPREHFEGVGICGVHKFKVYLEDDKDIHTFNRIKKDGFDNNPLFEGSTLSYTVTGKFELF